MNKLRRCTCLLILILNVIFIPLHTNTVFAIQEMDELDENKNASIQFQYNYAKTEDSTVQINGAEISIYKIADLNIVDGSPEYTLLENFQSLPIDFDGMTAEESNRAAQLLVREIRKLGKVADAEATTQNGVANFSEIEFGMYLFMQTSSIDNSTIFYPIQEFLVSVPNAVLNEDMRYEWSYEVIVEPKAEPIPKVTTTSSPVTTTTSSAPKTTTSDTMTTTSTSVITTTTTVSTSGKPTESNTESSPPTTGDSETKSTSIIETTTTSTTPPAKTGEKAITRAIVIMMIILPLALFVVRKHILKKENRTADFFERRNNNDK